MATLYNEAYLTETLGELQDLCQAWGLSPRTEVALLNMSENATFRADDPDAADPVILRVHRPYYHSLQEIESELAWIEALRAEGVVETPQPLKVKGGGHIANFTHRGETRHVVGFAFMEGREPDLSADLVDGFVELGAISARLHQHVERWPRPAAFQRKVWTFATTLGPSPHWGPWRAALGLTGDGRALLERTCALLDRQLAAYGTGRDRFGLIHADLRLANLLVHGDRIGVIDFDDCGFGWFGYDFAAAVSFYETDPIIPDLQAAWLRGYRSVAPMPAEDEAMLPTFVLLRRILLTAWIASHAETPTAADAGGAAFTDGTLALADRYLADHG
ncbi:MAG: phosphotransferase [Rhodospirillaceae bacterium]|nr:phosphotransferase [Rhodospirillaceae bacterium]